MKDGQVVVEVTDHGDDSFTVDLRWGADNVGQMRMGRKDLGTLRDALSTALHLSREADRP